MLLSGIQKRVMQVLWWGGLGLSIGGALLLILRYHLIGGAALGAGLAALGLNALLGGGEMRTGYELRPFTARGMVVRGRLESNSLLSDLSVGSCGVDRVAMVRFGPFGKPRFNVVDNIAHLRLRGSLLRPNVASWEANLAGNILWDVEARSWLGDLTFDLGDLRLDKVDIRSALGTVDITCPAHGYARLHLKTRIGQVVLHIPPEVEARVRLKRGWLSTLRVKNERLLSAGKRRFSTPDFEGAAAQVEVTIEVGAGDVILD
jgi:hypothetical protein